MTSALAGGRALITGAAGFIGRHLAERLEQAGVEVDRVSRRRPVDPGDRWHRCDLADAEAVRRLVASTAPDVIFHLAGEIRAARDLDLVLPTFTANATSTVNVLTAAAERNPETRVLLAGSLEEPERGGEATSPYAASKVAARAYADLFREILGLPVSVLRIFMVYGPGQGHPTKLVPYAITSLLRGEAPKLSSGVREIDWVYVDDVADAFVAAASADDAAAASVDVGSGEAVSIRDFVQRLTDLIDPSIVPEFGAVPPRPGEQVRVADVDAAERAIGWRPRVGLDEGLARTIEWYRRGLERGQADVA